LFGQANVIGHLNNWKVVVQKGLNAMSEECSVKGKLVFVMGGGKFGTNALRWLRTEGARVLVVDVTLVCSAWQEADVQVDNLDVCGSLKDGESAFLVGDAVEVLATLLETVVPDFVVTSIPGNAVARLVEVWLGKRGFKLVPFLEAVPKVLENLPESLVSSVDYVSGVIVVSYMFPGKRCRDNCMPPKNVCAVTGRPKPASMDKLLAFSVYNLVDVSGILVSPDLTGGLGAINGKDLQSLLNRLAGFNKSFTYAVGNACDCHGIINVAKAIK
jgi:hypothetical protein